MTTITLPPDLESHLVDEARRRGTTPELLALDGLRSLFAPAPSETGAAGATLFDYLSGYIGTVAGSSEPLSEECGGRFAAGLEEKQQRGRL